MEIIYVIELDEDKDKILISLKRRNLGKRKWERRLYPEFAVGATLLNLPVEGLKKGDNSVAGFRKSEKKLQSNIMRS